MAKHRADTVIQIHLPERWPDALALDEPPVRWAWYSQRGRRDGVSRLAEVPRADETILVLPVARVGFVRATLPPGPPHKLAKLAPFAIEDAIGSAPEDAHAVVLDEVRDGERPIAVLDGKWIESLIDALDAAGVVPNRAIVESALLSHAPDSWTVVWAGDGGFVSLGPVEAMTLDDSIEGRPPLALKLAADERRARGMGPRTVEVLLANGAEAPDVAQWSSSLHVPVQVTGRWRPEEIDGRNAPCPDLLPAAYTRSWAAGGWASRLRPAAILAGVILAGHALLTIVDWGRLAYEARSLRSEMETVFRGTFPDAKAVVDPALQMRRNLTELRRAAGEPDSADLVPLLAKLAPALTAANARPRALRFERGELQLEVGLPSSGPRSREELASRLRVPGLRVRVEQVGKDGDATVATVRVAPEGA
jgi:general secretion pathway protein L